MFNKILLLSAVIAKIIDITTCCSIPDDCGSYSFTDWTGRTFSVDTREVCTSSTDFGIFGCTCWTSKCSPSSYGLLESAQFNLLNNYNFDIGKCYAGDNGCSNPDWSDTAEVYHDLFHECCQIHDRCYSNSDYTAAECDTHFKNNMIKRCAMQYPESDTSAVLALCVAAAATWYGAVAAEGTAHHEWSADDCKGSNYMQYRGHWGCPWMDDKKYADLTLDQCKKACDNLSGCISIEYWPERPNGRTLCFLSKTCTYDEAIKQAYTAEATVGQIYFFTK